MGRRNISHLQINEFFMKMNLNYGTIKAIHWNVLELLKGISMGTYFNPNNESFRKDKKSEIYIDKTGLLEFLNKKIGTNNNCISVSHARRFGKSHAAGMIDAYYSRGSDSEELFSDTEIATKDSFREHLNKYNVIHLDISSIFDFHKEDLIEEIHKRISKELRQ